MSSSSKLLGAALRLPPVRTPRVSLQRDIEVPMADGEVLFADRHYSPLDERAPLVLIRTPYGRRSSAPLARVVAERGYQVLTVSLRGTAGSGGRFAGWNLEPADGTSLVSWMRDQPWFPGVFATVGASFLGYSQWALATEPIPEWRAAIIQDAPSEVYHAFMYRGGAFAFNDWLGWAQRIQVLDRGGGVPAAVGRWAQLAHELRRATDHLPVTEADTVAAGEPIDFYQDWLRYPEPDEFWAASDHRDNVTNMPPIVHVASGWYDIFLPGSLDDAVALQRSGRQVRLLIGPWTHGKGLFSQVYQADLFAVLAHALHGDGALSEAPVRVYLTGAGEWRTFDDWPPKEQHAQAWYLHAGGELSTRPPIEGPAATFRYDPADPTPTHGGPLLRGSSGPRDVRRIERRDDVLTFTSPLLLDDLDVVGPVSAEIVVRTSSPYADVFVRVCDVTRGGKSRHVCDGIVRLDATTPVDADRSRRARVELWPTAHRFKRGHRVRVHVCGGSHPRYLRNLGTGDQLGTTLRPVDHEVLLDPDHPATVSLPVLSSRTDAPRHSRAAISRRSVAASPPHH